MTDTTTPRALLIEDYREKCAKMEDDMLGWKDRAEAAERERDEAINTRALNYDLNQLDAILAHLGIADTDIDPIDAIKVIEQRATNATVEASEWCRLLEEMTGYKEECLERAGEAESWLGSLAFVLLGRSPALAGVFDFSQTFDDIVRREKVLVEQIEAAERERDEAVAALFDARANALEEAARLVDRIIISGPEDEEEDHDDYRDTMIARAIRAIASIKEPKP